LLTLCSGTLYGQFRTSFGAGLGYFLEQGGGPDIQSIDMILQNQSSYAVKSEGRFQWGFSAHSALLFRNFLLPETSHFVIYDFSARLPVLAGPFIALRVGGVELYCSAGPHILFTIVRHNEPSASLGNSYLEWFAVNTGVGIDGGARFQLRRVFFNLGVTFAYDFLRWVSSSSKFGDYAGWESPVTELRPYLLFGFSLERRKAPDEK
jgi:hypothetical protein